MQTLLFDLLFNFLNLINDFLLDTKIVDNIAFFFFFLDKYLFFFFFPPIIPVMPKNPCKKQIF